MRHKILVIATTALLSVTLLFCYLWATVPNAQVRFREIERVFYPKDKKIRATFQLSKDAYLLRIKWRYTSNVCPSVSFNGHRLGPNAWPYITEKKGARRMYVHIRPEFVHEGTNTVEISFFDSRLTEIDLVLRNYRRYRGGIYILFGDSIDPSDDGPAGLRAVLFIALTSLLGLASSLIAWHIVVTRRAVYHYNRPELGAQLLILLTLLLCSLAGKGASYLGYRVVVTPDFLCKFAITLLIPIAFVYSDFLLRIPLELLRVLRQLLPKAKSLSHELFPLGQRFLSPQRQFDVRVAGLLGVLIVGVNLWVYWPSFFHLFRHDEWFLFFSARKAELNLKFILEHVDWQLKLPYDRLMFRPIHHAMLAINRVIFDTNYVGPHIVTFVKHIIATLCLWWLMWQYSPRWISALFVLLFSVLIVNLDPVIWPHVDAYAVTSIFTILAFIIFLKTLRGQLSPYKGFALTSLFLFLSLLTTEIGFLFPLIFFLGYWVIFRDPDDVACSQKDVASWFVLFAPILLWLVLFGIHLNLAYPDLAMTSQSARIAMWRPFINVLRLILLLLSAMFFPMLVETRYMDKTYFYAFNIYLALFLLVAYFRLRGSLIYRPSKERLFSIVACVSVLVIVCFARSAYVDSLLNRNNMSTHYVYCASALVIFAVYTMFEFDSIRHDGKISAALLLVLFSLISIHALRTHRSTVEIQQRTAPLKKYFDSVKSFVTAHEQEPAFSFKMIDRPPRIKSFDWYHQTCIDGLFDRFIDYKAPKYVLEYSYPLEKLKYSYYHSDPISGLDTSPLSGILQEADYIGPFGIPFRKVPGMKGDLMVSMCEITQKQWQDVMGYNPSRFIDDNRPVENVSYYMVQDFIKRLNQIEGAKVYRLPSEKEYAYLVNYSILNPNERDSLHQYAWTKTNANGVTHPVGTLKPTISGFYDLLGNVWEWTRDSIHRDSPVPPLPTTPRVCFGASWRDSVFKKDDLVTNYPPEFRHEHLGFRLVRKVGPSDKE